MDILKSERFKNAEKEEQYFILDPKYIKEALTSGIEFGTLQFFVYHYMRWCEEKGKFRVMAAGKEHIAKHLGATTKEVEKALWDLSRKKAVSYIDFQQNIIRAKKKYWISNVRLGTISLPTGSQSLPTGSQSLPTGSQSLPTGSLPSPVTSLSENNIYKENTYNNNSVKVNDGLIKTLFDIGLDFGQQLTQERRVQLLQYSNLGSVLPQQLRDASKDYLSSNMANKSIENFLKPKVLKIFLNKYLYKSQRKELGWNE